MGFHVQKLQLQQYLRKITSQNFKNQLIYLTSNVTVRRKTKLASPYLINNKETFNVMIKYLKLIIISKKIVQF